MISDSLKGRTIKEDSKGSEENSSKLGNNGGDGRVLKNEDN